MKGLIDKIYNENSMELLKDLTALSTFINAQTLIITPNQRLKTYLINHLETQKTTTAWPTPNVVSLSDWLKEVYQDAFLETHSEYFLLSSTQEHYLWQQIIAQASENFISDSYTIANKAYSAWEFMHLWDISLHELIDYPQEDFQWFYNRAVAFYQLLEQRKFITFAQLPKLLATHHGWVKYRNVNTILLFGFDETTPQISALFDVIQSYKITIKAIDIHTCANKKNAYAFSNQEAEIKMMAEWAYNLYIKGKKHIACIVPSLLDNRQTIYRIFSEKFNNTDYFNLQQLRAPFSISGGEPLAQMPMIMTVIAILKSTQYLIDFSTINNLILSPYIGGALEEQNTRAIFAEKIRDKVFSQIKLKQIINKIHAEDHCPLLLENLKTIQRFPNKSPRTINVWIEQISLLLKKICWPGDRILSSIEYQQISKFEFCLSQLASLNFLTSEVSYTTFLTLLINQLTQQLFQPENKVSPVQVLGILEAAGQQFDAIWFMDLTDENWPASAKPNPFIPPEIQRKYNLPHANAERELDFAKRVQARFLNSCHDITFSWPENSETTSNKPSTLIKAYIANQEAKHTETTPKKITLSLAPLHVNLPVEKPQFSADASLIKKQAECPFQAFSHYRLKAKPLEKITFITNKKNRGILLHYVLQKFWQSFSSLNHLMAQSDLLTDILLNHTKKYVTKFYIEIGIDNTHFIEIEINRIYQLLYQWIEIELQRENFSIYEIEKSHTLFINKLKLRLRVDRVDQVHDGKLIIIDYKTGLSSEQKWLSHQFVEPQLPIYCLIFPKQVIGLAFAQLHAESMKFKGLTIETAKLPGMEKQKDFTAALNQFITQVTGKEKACHASKHLTFSEMLILQQAWQVKIEDIANDFINGLSEPNPVDTQVCTFCQRQSLCRVNNIKRIMTA